MLSNRYYQIVEGNIYAKLTKREVEMAAQWQILFPLLWTESGADTKSRLTY